MFSIGDLWEAIRLPPGQLVRFFSWLFRSYGNLLMLHLLVPTEDSNQAIGLFLCRQFFCCYCLFDLIAFSVKGARNVITDLLFRLDAENPVQVQSFGGLLYGGFLSELPSL